MNQILLPVDEPISMLNQIFDEHGSLSWIFIERGPMNRNCCERVLSKTFHL
jgi:hypothetical protein